MAKITKRGNGWEVRITYIEISGKYRESTKRGFSTREEAKEAVPDLERTLLARNKEVKKIFRNLETELLLRKETDNKETE
ncbi:hypothetical protein HCA89_00200 [Listeria innocua]|uniref:AP2-like integrase N-terminal domain-containing protein n=1 Tax=Listeria innocua TaxID=1642 RepID=A0AB73H3S7_LISIO|nr:Arm DNA-binding domain-containing protein [Listeria innocua]EAG1721828.1 hypothetical protein [Listeria monocytogenes]MBC2140713.1 hypothetical protein [Listeria innocua]